MNVLKWAVDKVKNFGVGAAINALDNIEKPLGDRIEQIREQFVQLSSYGMAKMLVDNVQDLLRKYFKIPDSSLKNGDQPKT